MALPSQIAVAARVDRKAFSSTLVDDAVLATPSQEPDAEAAERRTAILRVLGNAAGRHGCQRSARRGIGVCLIKGHAADLAWAADILQAAGLVPTPPGRRKSGIIREGTCPTCRRPAPVRLDGMIGVHRVGRATACGGRGERPVVEDGAS